MALQIARLTLERGIYWVKGANGSGKSTLLKAIAGVLDFSGNIHLDNISIKKMPVAYRKLVSYAEAEPVLPEFLTGLEMLALFRAARGGTAAEERYYLESMEMAAYLHQPLGTYSSGMLKKLSLVLAFLGRPTLILLDEPLITLDAASLEVLYTWITAKHSTQGTGFLLSSHQQLEQPDFPLTGMVYTADHTVKYLPE
ncbi:ABC transporter ATP-binding protein [Chitinophaga nivalis]|uniref:ATP-binding cassette domain-containing protein n=1 Tax=Chitinophaga nivalis TaxID=2991709 RepID=A0ABT3IJB6_9BACT|nr:ATP-binding cassette domain-containing protein [Chitinophaga nivalis]MCW3466248.1 ATP-binding cassette domain-containing protein [Chitinophaga nivalis]MCW3484061.1 ATP-binding cassette domain-containing protein [Chitinophaga nivalis]